MCIRCTIQVVKKTSKRRQNIVRFCNGILFPYYWKMVSNISMLKLTASKQILDHYQVYKNISLYNKSFSNEISKSFYDYVN